MKKILITGSSGLVGSEAVDFFSKKNFFIFGVDNNFRKYFFGQEGDTSAHKLKNISSYKNFIHHNIDIRNFNDLKKIFIKYKFDYILHAAAQPSHDWAKSNILLDFDVNAKGTLNLLELCRVYSPKAVFAYISTNKVYGDNPNKINTKKFQNRFDVDKNSEYYSGITETMSIDNNLHSFFGASKLSADLFAQEYGKNFGMNVGIFRAGCITGPNHSGVSLHGFLSFLIKTNLEKKIYKVFGYEGMQVRDNLHSYDLVSAIWNFFIKPKKGEIYNIGGGRLNSCSVLEAFSIAESLTANKMLFKIVKRNRVGDHRWYITNCAKFKKDYPNWKINFPLKKIFEVMVDKYSLYI